MADKKKPQNTQDIFTTESKTNKDKKTPNRLRQDKRGLGSTCTASNQPARSPDELRVDALGSFFEQEEFVNSQRQPLEKLTLYVEPEVKQWTKRQADRLGLSISSFAAPLYTKACQHHINLELSPELAPLIKQEIRRELRGQRQLNGQTAHDVQMVKQLLSYLLEHTPGVGRDNIRNLLSIAYSRANDEMKQRIEKLYRQREGSLTPSTQKAEGEEDEG
jgi:hypothetical protein